MASTIKDNSRYQVTVEQVAAWREQLFDGRALRAPVESLMYWPLAEYLWAAVLQAAALDALRAESEQTWQTPAWDFGRFAKAHPALLPLDENRALAEIKRAIGESFWTAQLKMDKADAEMAFDHIWVECRAVPGYDPLTIALLEASTLAKEASGNHPAGYCVFVEVARSLQRQRPDDTFMLPCHKLAPMLACLPMTISRFRKKAVRDGHLRIVKDHSFRSAGKSEATEFVFLGPL